MKKFIKIFSLVICLALILFSCGTDKNTGTGQTHASNTSLQTEELNSTSGSISTTLTGSISDQSSNFSNDLPDFGDLEGISTGLAINAVDLGISKFHRKDFELHPSALAANPSRFFTLPSGSNPETFQLIIKNTDNNFTIVFTTLESLFTGLKRISEENFGKRVTVLNIMAHGMPGKMWFPVDNETMNTELCTSWKRLVFSGDKENYENYYAFPEKQDIQAQKDNANQVQSGTGCLIDSINFSKLIKEKFQEIPAFFSNGAVITFLSCLVGLGEIGYSFCQSVGESLLSKGGIVLANTMYGTLDWSMGGMGFWDILSDDHYEASRKSYSADKQDSLITLDKGIILMIYFKNGNESNKYYLEFSGYLPIVTEPTGLKPLFDIIKSAPVKKMILPFKLLQKLNKNTATLGQIPFHAGKK